MSLKLTLISKSFPTVTSSATVILIPACSNSGVSAPSIFILLFNSTLVDTVILFPAVFKIVVFSLAFNTNSWFPDDTSSGNVASNTKLLAVSPFTIVIGTSTSPIISVKFVSPTKLTAWLNFKLKLILSPATYSSFSSIISTELIAVSKSDTNVVSAVLFKRTSSSKVVP